LVVTDVKLITVKYFVLVKMKAVCLLSGGLDSTLALKLILNQGIEVVALNFTTPFCRCNRGGCCWAAVQASRFGVKVKHVYLGEEYLEIVKKPRFGYGSQLNPCIDCRILMFKKAKDFMGEIGASFIFTGEVLGQRPMSQHKHALKLIEKEAGIEGLVVRPLSAKLLPPTIPEIKGWVKRDLFLSIRGRSRKEQMSLAKKLNIKDYPCPAGGCLLTDPNFTKRLKDLLEYSPNFTLNDVELLKIGRHFRLSPETKLVIGRNKEENEKLQKLMKKEDLFFHLDEYKGPLAILRGKAAEKVVVLAAEILAWYSTAPRNKSLKVTYRLRERTGTVHVKPAKRDLIEKYLI
jgi:tRNA U34 2-thiouridine synthase MnmA/TrmU